MSDNTAGPTAESITPSAPEEFGLVQVWWGDGKGKTTAALGMATRAVGHGYRVHLLQFMKGGTGTVEDVRGEYNAIAALPGFSYENAGHYGWHGFMDGSDDGEHEARAQGALARAREILDASGEADLSEPLDPEGPPEDGVNMLVVDEILYAANRGLVDPADVVSLVEAKPDDVELVLTGGHERPEYVFERADLVTEVGKVKHPLEAGHPARKGTEY
ncbi:MULTISPECIES: cob(I)yrinic acid a,c-diamide adenosyltransferase [Haloarcula]|uniref:Cob(I)alamin adenosyltransferase n=1 Tax=Haloarcula pellucida TaxID=1427151 RepID=A0A830GP45_9EURY|nr:MULTISPECIES: cob(I)yrinic acid a,c-diamide adenosyltransferase [Halomicroarcula]MBX0350304.1 cob(I)yrinic acid a,c-diamide adenosyltransferase [Halomicroarcula pellucida]MDS0277594.1 cob(I)yrinic acid a,c-diamide adenosyltransferase [Halomicroarcula sp. S1AR25-4]GGO01449.1 cob(I)alamin adenosyltransferase [Halomicroarcula pellucida]